MARNTQPIPVEAPAAPALGTIAQLRQDLEEVKAYLVAKETETAELVARVEAQAKQLEVHAETLAAHAAHFLGL